MANETAATEDGDQRMASQGSAITKITGTSQSCPIQSPLSLKQAPDKIQSANAARLQIVSGTVPMERAKKLRQTKMTMAFSANIFKLKYPAIIRSYL